MKKELVLVPAKAGTRILTGGNVEKEHRSREYGLYAAGPVDHRGLWFCGQQASHPNHVLGHVVDHEPIQCEKRSHQPSRNLHRAYHLLIREYSDCGLPGVGYAYRYGFHRRRLRSDPSLSPIVPGDSSSICLHAASIGGLLEGVEAQVDELGRRRVPR
jgi:hypothetical protein